MFKIELLPAKNGDALIVEYGEVGDIKRILIDGGTPGAYTAVASRLREIEHAEGHLNFELLVITHIDDDHIGGILSLLKKQEIPITFNDIWFNGYGHLGEGDIEAMGPIQGERLTQLLIDRQFPWNLATNGRSLRVHDQQPLPVFELSGGMNLTLLSPDSAKLASLRAKWEEVCAAAGLDPNEETNTGYETDDPEIESFGPVDMDELMEIDFHEDKAEANGSSIAFLADYEGKRVLFAADAHPTMLIRSISQIAGVNGMLDLDICKLSHHGSDHNTSADLIKRLNCRRFLISTSGARFQHPHRAAIARVIRTGNSGKEIVFNYRSAQNEVWDDESLKDAESYSTTFPDSAEGIVVEV